jgi:hypothetical protein
MRIFELFLPVHLPPELHDQGYKYEFIFQEFNKHLLFRLWLPEFMAIWENVYSNPVWELVGVD